MKKESFPRWSPPTPKDLAIQGKRMLSCAGGSSPTVRGWIWDCESKERGREDSALYR